MVVFVKIVDPKNGLKTESKSSFTSLLKKKMKFDYLLKTQMFMKANNYPRQIISKRRLPFLKKEKVCSLNKKARFFIFLSLKRSKFFMKYRNRTNQEIDFN